MAETINLFNDLWAAFNVAPATETEFTIRMESPPTGDYAGWTARNYIHVDTEIDETIGAGFVTFTSYQNEFAGHGPRADFCLQVTATNFAPPTADHGTGLKLVAMDGLTDLREEDYEVLATAFSWQELGLHFTRADDAKYFQLGVLFLQLADAYRGSGGFTLLEPVLQAA